MSAPAPVQAERRQEIVEAALELFCARGYRRTGIADVARALGVSPGLLYHYFESKEALFHTALCHALEPEAPLPTQLPIPSPEPGTSLRMLRSHLERWVAAPLLEQALARREVVDAGAEFETIVRSFFDGASRRRRAADLVERSALDLPDLAALWFGEIRQDHFARLTRYLEQRMARGHLRRFPSPEITAEIVIEIVVFFARHRQRRPYDEAESRAIRDAVVRFVLAALLPGEPEAGGAKG